MREITKKTSEIVAEIVDECKHDSTLTVAEFLKKMGNRAQGMAILVFSLSCVVAGVVPGFSTLMAVPIMFIALQTVLGMQTVWLPKSIRNRPLSPRLISGALARSIPTLGAIEKFLKPRLTVLTHPWAERLVALIIIMLAGVLVLPIPGGNFLPSIFISLLAFSMLERDGLFVLAAVLLVISTGGMMADLAVAAFNYASNMIDDYF